MTRRALVCGLLLGCGAAGSGGEGDPKADAVMAFPDAAVEPADAGADAAIDAPDSGPCVPTGERCEVGTGACRAEGFEVCGPDGVKGCSVTPRDPAPEVCDGVDNDCDGTVDDDPADATGDCDTGLPGACGAGRRRCLEGRPVCTSVVEPTDETCNGLDDDCNELVDDAPDGLRLTEPCDVPAEAGVGECRGGLRRCDDGVPGACEGAVGPVAEVCNRRDDDCNGLEDDVPGGCACEPGATEACYAGPGGTAGVGSCRAGTWTCEADGRAFGACAGEQRPEPERCNGLDDDCDGITDEDIPGAGEGCADACGAAGLRACEPAVAGLVCVTEAPGAAPEACNGLDDDCDGAIDEDFSLGAPCDELAGACVRHGLIVCGPEGGSICGILPAPLVPETCNGLDDDCDGSIDEDFGLGAACAAGQGACTRLGAIACAADGTTACDAVPGPPEAERCNGLDDDCDGEADEGLAGAGLPCDTGRPGACAAGRSTCGAGGPGCEPLAEPGDETCNGLDDDCDGATDEDLSRACYDGPAGTEGVGRCAAGRQSCGGGALGACLGQVLPAPDDACTGEDADCDGRIDPPPPGGCACDPVPETCNGQDDDCDGTIDDVPGVGEACADGVGACRAAGTFVCNLLTGEPICDAIAGAPAAETCNGRDDDCDGAVDDVDGLGLPCEAGLGVCSRQGAFVCDAVRGQLACSATPGAPAAEVCDQLDNDCNGVADDGNLPGTGAACGTGQPGECAAGRTACRGGAIRCEAVNPPAPERCNGRDDDCDGAVDDDPTDAGVACSVEQNGCASLGVTECVAANQLRCNAQPGVPSAEICDGRDNDCDGQADEQLDCRVYRSCLDAYVRGARASGVYRLQPAGAGGATYDVFCDQVTDRGGWTLVGSALNTVLQDARGDWHPDLTTLGPNAARDTIWDGLRGLSDRFDVRFACRDAPAGADAPMTVDLSFYRVDWYHDVTAGPDAQTCFLDGETAMPLAPARRNNLNGALLPRGNQFDYGYMEGEDACDAADDFAIDFDDRGKDSLQSDGTDWGEDDGAWKCGRSGNAGGQWMLLVRERGRVAVVGPDVAAPLQAAGFAAEALPYDANLPGRLDPETYETLFLGRYATRWPVVTEALRAALVRFSEDGGNLVTEWDGAALLGEGYDASFRYTAGAAAPLGLFPFDTGGGDVVGANTAVLPAAVGDPLLEGLPVPFRAGSGTESFFTLVPDGARPTWLTTVATANNQAAIARGRRCGGNVLLTTFDWQDNPDDPGVRALMANLAREAVRPPSAALEDPCRPPLRPDVMVCGNSARDPATFLRGGAPLRIVAGCNPGDRTQALLVTRAGLPGLNPDTVRAYLSGGGIVITEQATSDEIFAWAFNAFAPQAPQRTGACRDNVMPAVQLNPGDPFWEENRFEPVAGNETGCGFDASAFPGLVPLGGPAPGVVTLGYRDLGPRGRVWVVESDWSDGEPGFTASSSGLMHHMITHGPRPLTLSGVQTDLDPMALARGGFEACYQGDYAGGRRLFDVAQACDQGVLLMACRPAGASRWQLGAMAARADVFFDVGAGANAVHAGNGLDWYYSTAPSWGFAPAGAGVNRDPCDTVNGADAAQRLCWLTGNNNLNAGGRCGAATGLGVGWERVIFERPGPL